MKKLLSAFAISSMLASFASLLASIFFVGSILYHLLRFGRRPVETSWHFLVQIHGETYIRNIEWLGIRNMLEGWFDMHPAGFFFINAVLFLLLFAFLSLLGDRLNAPNLKEPLQKTL